MTSVKLKRNFLHMDVLCIRHYLDYILAGIGNNLFVYKNSVLALTKQIFENERLHAIYIHHDSIFLKGGRWLSVAKLKVSEKVECEIISQIECSDWIQDVILFEKELVNLVTAHNAFQRWSLKPQSLLNSLSCEETCILYSCKIIGDSTLNVVVFAGTVFGDVLIWAPCAEGKLLLQRLKAHNGAVFSIDVKTQDKIITTTSDDRSFRVWSIISSSPISCPKDWKATNIQLIYTLFGHTARVWKSMILPTAYLTAGEDSQVIVWSKNGKMVKTFNLHQESGVRAVDYSIETDQIATGGEDGGINIFFLNNTVLGSQAKLILDLGQKVSTKVSFIKNGLVYTLNGACMFVSDSGEEILYKNEKFLTYCILETFPESEYIIMGSMTGDVVVINSETKQVTDEKLIKGRVYSIHWFGTYVLTCGPEGSLILWKFFNGVLQELNSMSLPNSRERWTTCGAIHNGMLIVGDRMGGIHLYDLRDGEIPVNSFRKIHGYLGVTDIKSVGGVCLSVGRDGTVKEFRESGTLLTTYKLPMEWPWKIVNYEDDILILGFHSVAFIVWSMKMREIIASHDCGGGHRSCDYKIHGNKMSFLYVKEKKVFVVILPLNEITRVRCGFHGKEINCLKIIKTNPTVIVTGSEDTTLRVSVVSKSEVRQIQILKTHISSIRALGVCYNESQKTTIVSVGGKGQIVIWDFDLETLKCQEMVNYRLNKAEENWKSSALSTDPETRIMCVDIFKLENELLIAIGCSDCRVKLFSYSKELRELYTMSYTHCVLNIIILKMNSLRVVVSMGTDGRAVFWDITDSKSFSQLGKFSLHQSGINSFHFEEIECGKFILATGGDDNLISIAVVDVKENEVYLRQVWRNSTAHSCQITGMKILKTYLVTASIDQRITLWKWSFHEDEFTINFLNQFVTAVPDVQGMDATWQETFAILVTAYGKGMEILQIDVTNTKDQTQIDT